MKPILTALSCALACLAFNAQALSFGENLIVNGDAEAGTTGWTVLSGTSLFASEDYGSNWVLPTEPGPVNRGAKLFVGGSGVPLAGGWQSVSLQDQVAAISSGQAGYQLSGWLGGWTNQGDNALLYVSFLDASNTEIGHAMLGPTTAAGRNNTTGLYLLDASGVLPTATRSVVFSLSMERLNGGDNDGYADNLSFSLVPVPEPETWALMLSGLAGVATLARRRRSAV